MGKKKETFIPPSVEDAIKTLKEHCDNNVCIDCPLSNHKDECKLKDRPPVFWEI